MPTVEHLSKLGTLSPIEAKHLGFTMATGLTATGSTSQANAYQIDSNHSIFNTVTSINDSAKLPTAVNDPFGVYVVRNEDSADTLFVFPASGDSINNYAANASVTVPPGTAATFYRVSSTRWIMVIGHGSGQLQIGSSSYVNGTLPIANGGTGQSSLSYSSFAGSVTLTPSAGAVAGSTITIARKLKVGDTVFIRLFLVWQQSDAGATTMTIGGLPHTSAATNQVTRIRVNLNGVAGTADASVLSSSTSMDVDPLGANWPLTASQNNAIVANLFYEAA